MLVSVHCLVMSAVRVTAPVANDLEATDHLANREEANDFGGDDAHSSQSCAIEVS